MVFAGLKALILLNVPPVKEEPKERATESVPEVPPSVSFPSANNPAQVTAVGVKLVKVGSGFMVKKIFIVSLQPLAKFLMAL